VNEIRLTFENKMSSNNRRYSRSGSEEDESDNDSNKPEKIKIDTKEDNKPKRKNKKLIKALEIVLTLFYGQFIANAIYDNFLRGIPEIIQDSTAYFSIVKVTIGILICAITMFSLVVIWLKIWKLIFFSGCLLILIFICSLIITIIDLVQRKERKQISDKDFNTDVAQLIIESLFRVLAALITFWMVKLLKTYYQPLPTVIT
jgi:hypothetical protein